MPELPAEAQKTVSAPIFPVVALGASAGGLASFRQFFSGITPQPEPGMAFVLIQHLAPGRKSLLPELLAEYTPLPVLEVEEGMMLEPNHVYVNPPDRYMLLEKNTLHLMQPPNAPNRQQLIDFFFLSLSKMQGRPVVGILLSGNGSDGSQGLRALKSVGALALVQSPETCEFASMPQSAIELGIVDCILAPEEMYGKIQTFVSAPSADPHALHLYPASEKNNILQKILVLLRAQTGHDFSLYKPNTILRRLERRMAIHRLENLEKYLQFLFHSSVEIESLFQDLLIGVTSFFRDPEAFATFEQEVLPKLFANRPEHAPIRVWVPGCSTGEEAYSLAILFQEYMEKLKTHFDVHIFATDIDKHSVNLARAGFFPICIRENISPERLSRFFTEEPAESGYRINKGIREMLIFSEQSVTKDPPFSKLDLISCRNLLIYLGSELQKKLIHLFYYSLHPGGILFLGNSESISDLEELFVTVDRKAKIFQKRTIGPDEQGAGGKCALPASFIGAIESLPSQEPQTVHGALSLRDLTRQTMLNQVMASAVLVNLQGDILYFHGRTGMYLEPAPGEVGSCNVLKMARPGLQRNLTMALHRAGHGKKIVQYQGVRVKTNGDYSLVNLTVCPVKTHHAAFFNVPLFLVVFQNSGPCVADTSWLSDTLQVAESEKSYPDAQTYIDALKQELHSKGEYLKITNEELATTNEELKSSNEELQSTNEELQSANEELETSKEELQSVNEELATINAELLAKVAELSRANSDMNNLLAGSGIATIFVDHQLRILRFTPAATRIINLIPNDVGRPVNHLAFNLVHYDTIVEDVRAVLANLVSKKSKVQTQDGRWFTMRIQPYRTLDNVIGGAVLIFIDDIMELTGTWEGVDRLALVAGDAHDAIVVYDLEGRILSWNTSATRIYGWSEVEALDMNIRDIVPSANGEEALAKMLNLSRTETLEPFPCRRLGKCGELVEVTIVATALVNDTGQSYAVASLERLAVVNLH
ncbi:MAG: chemotaxis protein CheB [Desulfobulbus sp.]|nr:chemotaxis protein CheB [Desulfobulbus sp.]